MGAGIELKKILSQRGMTVADLSKESGIPASTLYSLIQRDSGARWEILEKISDTLKINTLSDLLKNSPWEDIPSITIYSDIKDKLLDKFDQLNDIGQEKAVERIEELTEIPKYQK